MPLHTDYRPTTLDQMIGNDETRGAIAALLKKEDANRAILFHGPSGCGKTTLARVVARHLGVFGEDGEGPDYHELNASDFRGIEMVRQLRKDSQYRARSGARVWLLDECHKLTGDAQEAMLKLLEHPPAGNWFLLATTEPERLKITLRRRCAQFAVRALSPAELRKLLLSIAGDAGLDIPKSVIKEISKQAQGSPGLALSILDAVSGLEPDHMVAAVGSVASQESQVIALCQGMLKRLSWPQLAEILKGLEDEEPESVRRAVLEYFRKVLLGGNESAYIVLEEFADPYYDSGRAGLALSVYRVHAEMQG